MSRRHLPAVLLVLILAGCRQEPAPSGQPGGSPPTAWSTSLPEALQRAQTSGKPVVVDFFATWCGPCKMLEETWAKPQVQSALVRFITVKIDVDQQQQLAQQYKIESLPTIVFIGPDGEEKDRQIGYIPAHEMRKLLDENS